MPARFIGSGLLFVLFCALSLAEANGQPGKKKTDTPPSTPLDSEQIPPGEYTGKLITVPDADGMFTLQIAISHYEPKNPNQLAKNATQQQQRLAQEQQRIARIQAQLSTSRNATQYAQNMQQLQMETARFQQLLATQGTNDINNYKVVNNYKDSDMKLLPDADIRYMNLPNNGFDDEGKQKKYTTAELKELRGKKSNLPGYEGKLVDLKANQTVKVTLVRVNPKPAAKDAPAKDTPKKDDTIKDDTKKDDTMKDGTKKDSTDKPPPEKKMFVKMIVILADAPDPPPNTKGKGKNKNKD